jgi:hypothetical protein
MYEHIDVIWLVFSYYITLRWVVDLITYRASLMSNIRICSYFAFISIGVSHLLLAWSLVSILCDDTGNDSVVLKRVC